MQVTWLLWDPIITSSEDTCDHIFYRGRFELWSGGCSLSFWRFFTHKNHVCFCSLLFITCGGYCCATLYSPLICTWKGKCTLLSLQDPNTICHGALRLESFGPVMCVVHVRLVISMHIRWFHLSPSKISFEGWPTGHTIRLIVIPPNPRKQKGKGKGQSVRKGKE